MSAHWHSASTSLSERRDFGCMKRYVRGGMALSDIASQTSCNWFRVGLPFEFMLQVEKFRCSLPFRTSRSIKSDSPGRLLYHGHCVWSVWQSRQARVMIGRKFSGTARSPLTGVFVWACENEYSEASPPHTIAIVRTAVLSLTRPLTSTQSTSCACRRVHGRISPYTPPDTLPECPELSRRNPWFRHKGAGPNLDLAALE